MAIKDWPVSERPREKLLHRGAQSLSDAELLAIFLRTAPVGSNAVELARSLLQRFGGLRRLLHCDTKLFLKTPGLGPARYAQLQAALEIARRHNLERLCREDALESPAQTRSYLSSLLRDRPFEVFACLFLDTKNRVICCEELFRGTLDRAEVHPREVLNRCLFHNAAAVIFAHNHPSGVSEPSRADIALTQRLRKALELVDIRLVDHLIIGDGEPASLAELGLL
jgi:DNA repair protein RadC